MHRGARSTYRKVRDCGAFDFALVGAAIRVTLAGNMVRSARAALSGVAAAPWRSTDAEKVLAGKPRDAATISAAAEAAVKDARAIGKNDYKIALARGVREETLAGLAKAEGAGSGRPRAPARGPVAPRWALR
jgi:xanthine dehydrogenase YagS FAD-binding subunit